MSTPKLLLFLATSFIIYLLSTGLWVRTLYHSTYKDLIDTALTINIMSVGFFIIVGFANIKPIVIFFKSLIKIAFTVWVVLLVQFSALSQEEQKAWVILCGLFFVYLEVFLDFNDMFHGLKEFQSNKIKFLNNKFFEDYSLPLSLLLTSLLNIILSFFIIDLLNALSG